MSKFTEFIKERVGAIPGEVGDMIVHKTAQGAAEISQALNSQSNAYVPYGVGQAPLEVEGPGSSYQSMLRDAASHGVEHDQGRDR